MPDPLFTPEENSRNQKTLYDRILDHEQQIQDQVRSKDPGVLPVQPGKPLNMFESVSEAKLYQRERFKRVMVSGVGLVAEQDLVDAARNRVDEMKRGLTIAQDEKDMRSPHGDLFATVHAEKSTGEQISEKDIETVKKYF